MPSPTSTRVRAAPAEADDFYAAIPRRRWRQDADRASVLRQALAGMLWSKQYFYYDLDRGSTSTAPAPHLPPHAAQARAQLRMGAHEQRRHHLDAGQVGVPVVRRLGPRVPLLPLGMVDPDFAKQQLELMLRNDYLHPNGQMPAYEWNFGDVNPPVHAWATLRSTRWTRSGAAARATSSSSSAPSPS